MRYAGPIYDLREAKLARVVGPYAVIGTDGTAEAVRHRYAVSIALAAQLLNPPACQHAQQSANILPSVC